MVRRFMAATLSLALFGTVVNAADPPAKMG